MVLLPQTQQLKALMTIIRDQNTKRADFVFYADRIIRILVEEGNISLRKKEPLRPKKQRVIPFINLSCSFSSSPLLASTKPSTGCAQDNHNTDR